MFQLHTLGWHSFQQLCLSVLREVLGQTVEAFLDVNDGGRDGAFAGTWSPQHGEMLSGKFVVQCKFTGRPGYSLRPSDLADEFDKVQRLVDDGRCDAYVLMTNAGVSGQTDQLLKSQLALVGVEKVLVLGSTWIEQQLRENKNLRMMVPRVYGLGDLTQIIDERAYDQAAAVLESMRDDLAKVVVTDSYRKAAKALNAHGFVLLIGEPAAGKTTIASMLAMASADKWGAMVVKADSPREVLGHWNPKEKFQLFWIDDAFGVTQFESSLVAGWNHALPQLKSMLNKGSSIVMTSRDYIYNHARNELKESAFPLFRESQTVVDVQNLTPDERTQILYNHLKLGRQPQAFRRAIKEHLPLVAQHPRFIPEIARRISEPMFTKGLSISEWSLGQFVERRESFLVELCQGLDSDCKAALALIYMRKSKLSSPVILTEAEEVAVRRLDSNLGACSSALSVLRGSLVVYVVQGDEAYWSFKHPTIGDAYASILRSSPELLGIYVHGAKVDKMMAQVTCGDVQIKGAIVLPKALYGLVTERLRGFQVSSAYKTDYLATWHAKRAIKTFLAHRCSKDFLEGYLQADPSILDSVASPSPPLEFSEDVDLAIRLFELNLLTEDHRCSLVAMASKEAWIGNDSRILNDQSFRAMLTTKESSRLEHAVRTELLPHIEMVRLRIQANFNDDGEARWHMRKFEQLLSAVEVRYPTSRRVQNVIFRSRKRAQEWIEQQDTPDKDDGSRDITAQESDNIPVSSRSVFDDIDEDLA